LETLFPGGSLGTTAFLYRDWAVARYMNGLARAAVEAWVRAQPADLALRVLEVGAGTGGTTSALLPVLPAGRTAYAFTDVSPFFTDHARDAFAAYPFVRHGLLDLERDPREQGWEPGTFHLVIAANVLHATQDLDQTLDRVRGLLAPGGMLVAYEATVHHPWFDVTTGLIEGWQRFADGWRDGHPLLPPARWAEALAAHGFERVAAFPEAGSPAEILGQHVIVAVVPGTATATGGLAGPADRAHEVGVGSGPDGAGEPDLRRQVEAAAPADRHEMLIGHVREVLARVLRLEDPGALDRRSRLMDLGIDSLMALDLRKRLGNGLGLARALPATLVFDHPSIDAIARLLAREIAPEEPADGPRPAGPAPAGARLAIEEVAALDDEDVEALLLRKLESLR
jgi:SAM-dependent methyltransferase